MTAAEVRRQLDALADPDAAARAQRFFKTGPGEYGEGDRFLGIRVPRVRQLVRAARGIERVEIGELLRSEWHEARLFAVLALVDAYPRADPAERAAIVDLYLDHTAFVNNWDLVDSSAHHLIGPHVEGLDDLSLLDELAASESVWERRIAVVATLHFIRQREYLPTLHLAAGLLGDPHDLIHKATGWMLREVGTREPSLLVGFVERHGRQMPRTMLRAAIERLPEPQRQTLLASTR